MPRRYTISVAAGPDGYKAQLAIPKDRQKTSAALHNMLQGVFAGVYRGGQVDVEMDDGNGGTAASQTVTYGGTVTGAQTIVIAGRSVAFTAVNIDPTGTALVAVAAIQADAIANRLVRASNVAGVVTLKANTLPAANTLANGATLTATGTGATAGGATFAGGVNSTNTGFPL